VNGIGGGKGGPTTLPSLSAGHVRVEVLGWTVLSRKQPSSHLANNITLVVIWVAADEFQARLRTSRMELWTVQSTGKSKTEGNNLE
jgi:hypothetical protein